MGLTPIVTACDERYWPGLVALHNSYLRHSRDGFSFHALVFGSREFADRVEGELGIGVIHEPAFPASRLPTSRRYPEPLPVFYARLLVPSLFPDSEKSLYIDTDSLILQSLQPLVDLEIGERPVAATRSNSPNLGREIVGGPEDAYGLMSSLYVFNHGPWAEKRIIERCVEVMEDESAPEFITVAQGVLSWVLGDDWHELPWATQVHAGHKTWAEVPREAIYTLHFLGTNPWEEFSPFVQQTPLKLKLRELWKTYASRC